MLFIQKSGIFSRTINAKGHLFGNKTNIKDDFTITAHNPAIAHVKPLVLY